MHRAYDEAARDVEHAAHIGRTAAGGRQDGDATVFQRLPVLDVAGGEERRMRF